MGDDGPLPEGQLVVHVLIQAAPAERALAEKAEAVWAIAALADLTPLDGRLYRLHELVLCPKLGDMRVN